MQGYSHPPQFGMHQGYSHMPVDPIVYYGYGYNPVGLNWWNYATTDNVDPKIARIAYQVGSQLVKDRLKDEIMGILGQSRVKLFDFALDGDFASFLEALGLKVDIVRPHEIPIHVTTSRLTPNQMVFISGMFMPLPPKEMQNMNTFVLEGGRLAFFNCAPHLIAGIFPGKILPLPHSTTVTAKIKIMNEKELFTGFKTGDELALDNQRYSFFVYDKQNVKVLAKTLTPAQEPLVIKFNHGAGVVYHIVSKLFTTKKNIPDLPAYLKAKGASQITLVAWQCYLNVGYKAELAVSAWPSLELFARIASRELSALEQIQNEQQQQEQQQESQQPIPEAMEEGTQGIQAPEFMPPPIVPSEQFGFPPQIGQ